MAIAWLLVAIVEFTAERISASPLTYLLPQRGEPPVDEAEARVADARGADGRRRRPSGPSRKPSPSRSPKPEPEPRA